MSIAVGSCAGAATLAAIIRSGLLRLLGAFYASSHSSPPVAPRSTSRGAVADALHCPGRVDTRHCTRSRRARASTAPTRLRARAPRRGRGGTLWDADDPVPAGRRGPKVIFQPAGPRGRDRHGRADGPRLSPRASAMTLNDLELPREADNVDFARDSEPRLLDRGRDEHHVHRRRGHVRQVPLPPVPHRRRSARLPAAAEDPLRRRLLSRLARRRAGPAHRVPADPRRRRHHDPQLRLQELRDGGRRPRRDREPADLLDRPTARRPATS